MLLFLLLDLEEIVPTLVTKGEPCNIGGSIGGFAGLARNGPAKQWWRYETTTRVNFPDEEIQNWGLLFCMPPNGGTVTSAKVGKVRLSGISSFAQQGWQLVVPLARLPSSVLTKNVTYTLGVRFGIANRDCMFTYRITPNTHYLLSIDHSGGSQRLAEPPTATPEPSSTEDDGPFGPGQNQNDEPGTATTQSPINAGVMAIAAVTLMLAIAVFARGIFRCWTRRRLVRITIP